ncbi:T9SS type A sorting domain-containing protein [Dyadobacter sp. LHD-138]|uniref:T9SS type A sorting domain-containing protein n=1 Tax=Dyadobacter sp. LHD-138 TaxID=3071413 RepID=UPI0027E1DA4B|nr:T9SS type A sorting domain-containing protein [Dyadobacter sp. LHD-138]MDQ6478236.1 T9SS type A sorting domain-containing protein [Dyadobacter sp. LHD-138]
MILLQKSAGLWVTILVLTLISTFAMSQHLPRAAGQIKNRITGRSVSTARQPGNRLVGRNEAGNDRIRALTARRRNVLINGRASATQDCGSSCLLASPLPVKLIEFNGVRLDQSQVLLSWTTTEEVNNDHFDVERTLNPANGFQVVGSVKGKNYSSQNVSYKLTDPNVEADYTYYRLKQVDGDGSSSYSRIIGVKGFSEVLAVIPFPNPARARDLKFLVSGHTKGESLSVQVCDVTGNIIYQNNAYTLADDKQISLPGIRNQAGSFVIKIKNAQQQASSSFVMMN